MKNPEVLLSAEVNELKTLKASLDRSIPSIENMGIVLSGKKDLLSDIPTIWPLKGVRGMGYSDLRSLAESFWEILVSSSRGDLCFSVNGNSGN